MSSDTLFFFFTALHMNTKSKFELEIVRKVRTIRKERNKGQTYIAMVLKVSDGYIGQIEGERWPAMYTYDQLNKIAIDFGCSPQDFIPIESIIENYS